ncbi:GNAT family N-acetyltransferase [Vibrio sonorensis]|uniref:GNAT family N-acetyltransferase n=1 Tax=Vibrio sonorensis TaxID=1004316 RepID=UPI0008D9370B|nr:GNAT family N-acetyltransferase [Vibrio sonorensis]
MIVINSERLTMGQIINDDWSLFLRLNQEPEVTRYAFDPPSEQEIKARFESRLPKWKWGSEHWLCLTIRDKESGEAIGVTGLCISDKEKGDVEVGYLLLPEFHGKGFGTESLIALIGHVVSAFPITCITAIVTDGNIASCKVLEKSGFTLEEREADAYEIGGKLYDDLIYRKHI